MPEAELTYQPHTDILFGQLRLLLGVRVNLCGRRGYYFAIDIQIAGSVIAHAIITTEGIIRIIVDIYIALCKKFLALDSFEVDTFQ